MPGGYHRGKNRKRVRGVLKSVTPAGAGIVFFKMPLKTAEEKICFLRF
jgi:hypothetical protein